MVLCTGRTPSDVPAQASFKARSNTQPSRLDHVLVDCNLFHAIQSCGVGPVRPESDHLPLELQLLLDAPTSLASAPPPSGLNPAWTWDGAQQEVYACALQAGPCQALLSQRTAAAREHQHTQASILFHSAIDAAAQAAGCVTGGLIPVSLHS